MVEHIVTFASPPVVEVVAGVSFDAVSQDVGAVLAAFWKDHLRRDFPRLQRQPPYTPPVEEFPSDPRVQGVQVALSETFPETRLWAESEDGQQLVQLQPGWFACNWRKVAGGGEYDRWQARREALSRWLTRAGDYLTENSLKAPAIRQCEVTYVNHIAPNSVWRRHDEFTKVFTITSTQPMPHNLEQVTAQFQFTLREEGEPVGRCYAKIGPAFSKLDSKPLYILELTARGAPIGSGVEGALRFLDIGRAAIDQTFLALTTEAMHREWGRYDQNDD